MSHAVKVAVRVRPLIQKEMDEGAKPAIRTDQNEPSLWVGQDNFTFDYVFSMADPQSKVYTVAVQQMISHLYKGLNATIMAYGQTSSGKTHTMSHDGGVIPCIVKDLFYAGKEDTKITVSYLEILNDEIWDLMMPGGPSLQIREDKGNNITIPGLSERHCISAEAVMSLLEEGGRARSTQQTRMNQASSRSHAVATVSIRDMDNKDVVSTLRLVDLAGSEAPEGIGRKEGININKSLLALGNVINAIIAKKKHVPFRTSKLTRVLQDSLGGNSHTLLIACVSPADTNAGESKSTLRFAERVARVTNRPRVNKRRREEESGPPAKKRCHQPAEATAIHSRVKRVKRKSLIIASEAANRYLQRNAQLQAQVTSFKDKCQRVEEELKSTTDKMKHSHEEKLSSLEAKLEGEVSLRISVEEREHSVQQELNAVQSQLAESNAKIETLQMGEQSLSEKCSKKDVCIQELKCERDTLSATVSDLSQSIESAKCDLVKSVENASQCVQDLNISLKHKEEECQSLSEQCESHYGKCQALEAEVQKLHEEQQQSKERDETLTLICSLNERQLQNLKETHEEELHDMQKELEVLREQVDRLKTDRDSQVQAMAQDIDQQRKDNETLTAQLQAQVTSFKDKCQRVEEELKSTTDKMKHSHEEKLSSLEAKLEGEVSLRISVEEREHSVQQELNAVQSQLAESNAKIETLQMGEQSLSEKCSKKDVCIQELKCERDTLSATVSDLSQSIESAKCDLVKSVENASQCVQDLNISLKHKEEECQSLSEQCESHYGKCQALEAEVQKLHEEQQQSKERDETLTLICSLNERQLQNLKETHEEELHDMQKELEVLREQVDRLKTDRDSQVQAMAQDIDQQRKDNETLTAQLQAQVTSFKDKCQRVEEELKSTTDKMKHSHEEKLSSLEAKLEGEVSLRISVEEREHSVQQELNAVQSQLAESNAKIETLQMGEQSLSEKCSKKDVCIQELKCERDTLSATVSDLSQSIESAKCDLVKSVENASQCVQDLNISLKHKEEECQSLSEQCESHYGKCQALEAEVQKLHEEQQQSKEREETLTLICSLNERQLQNLKETHEEELHDMQKELEVLREQVDRLKTDRDSQVQAMAQDIDQQRKDNETLTAQQMDKSLELEKIKDKLDSLQEEFQTFKSESNSKADEMKHSHEEKLSSLEAKLEGEVSLRISVEEREHSVQQELNAVQSQLAESNAKIETLQMGEESLSEKCSKKDVCIQELKCERDTLSATVSDLSQSIESAKCDLVKSSEQIKTLQAENGDVKHQLENASQCVEDFSKQCESHYGKCQDLEAEVQKLHEEQQQSKETEETMQKELKELREQVDRLKTDRDSQVQAMAQDIDKQRKDKELQTEKASTSGTARQSGTSNPEESTDRTVDGQEFMRAEYPESPAPNILSPLELSLEDDGPKSPNEFVLEDPGEMPEEPALEFTKKLENMTVNETTTVTLECQLSKPNVPVKWTGPVFNARIRPISGAYTHQLIITDVTLEDAGKYRCVVGSISCDCTLEVKDNRKDKKTTARERQIAKRRQIQRPADIPKPRTTLPAGDSVFVDQPEITVAMFKRLMRLLFSQLDEHQHSNLMSRMARYCNITTYVDLRRDVRSGRVTLLQDVVGGMRSYYEDLMAGCELDRDDIQQFYDDFIERVLELQHYIDLVDTTGRSKRH